MERLPVEKREFSRKQTLGNKNLDQGLWVFGYGSLMWNPAFRYEVRLPGVLKGYHRSFCILATFARGTPERPGLSLGLKEGGNTHGLVFKIAPQNLEVVTYQLWEREMISGVLIPRWCEVETEKEDLTALTFVANREHPSYVEFDLETSAKLIRSAAGKNGTCLEYLVNTVEQLDLLGVADLQLKELLVATMR